MRLYSLIKVLGIAAVFLASPAKAEVFGPKEPKTFVYPTRFTVQPYETLDQAQDKITKQRQCAKRWMLIGTVGGSALDIVTTQINQKDGYREINPLYGKRASIGEQLLFNGITSGWSYYQVTRASKDNPYGACKTAKIYTGLKFIPGGVNLILRF